MSSSTCTIELELQSPAVQERSSVKPKEEILDRRVSGSSRLNPNNPDTNQTFQDGEREPDLEPFTSDPLHNRSVVIAHAREKWNNPSVNISRLFATFWSFVIMGANDAAYGVSSRDSFSGQSSASQVGWPYLIFFFDLGYNSLCMSRVCLL